MNENHTQTPKKRSGWIGFFSACLLLLLIALPIGLYWWHSDADLVDIRKKAAANNIPVTWSEFGLKISEPDRLARWKRIVELSKKLPSYQGLRKYDNPKFILFSPIPAEMRAHHATLDETIWTELLTELELLGDQPLCFHDNITFDTLIPEIGEYRDLIRLLHERNAIVDTPEALRICSVQLTLCRSFHNNSLLTHMVKTASISLALDTVSHHLAAFKKLDSQLTNDITSTTEYFPQQLIQSLTGGFLGTLQHFSKPGGSLGDDWYMPLVVRAVRHELLTIEIDSITYFRDHDLLTSQTWHKDQMIAFRARNTFIPSPGVILYGMVLPQSGIIFTNTHETQLKGRLLAAELKNQPWPQDIFDPTGSPLRPVKRDGKIIGAYSVGSNGIDDGGDKKLDRYFPLYGPLELPVAPTTP